MLVWFKCAALAVATALLLCLCCAVCAVQRAITDLPAVVRAELQTTRHDLVATVNAQGDALRVNANQALLLAIRKADKRYGDTLARVDRTLDIAGTQAGRANDTLAGFRLDVQPTLVATHALVGDAKDSLDDLYPDLKATVESGTVAVTSFALASESIRTTAPQLAASATAIGRNVDGISADVHVVTSDFVKPLTGWQKVKAFFKWLVAAGARAL